MLDEQTDKHGNRVETRRLYLSDELAGWRNWPGLKTACKIEREVYGRKPGEVSLEVHYAISSVELHRFLPEWFQKLWREHWHVENKLHYVRDVSMGEDACRVRSGDAPQILAALRNAVIALLRQVGHQNIAAALRHHAVHVLKALQLIGIT